MDGVFILGDLVTLAIDETTNGGANRVENLTALGADSAGLVVPFATGGGVAVRATNEVAGATAKAAQAATRAEVLATTSAKMAPGDGVRLYRSVGPNELKNVQQTGKFSLGPNGAEVKGFVTSLSDAKALAKAYDAPGKPQTVVSGLAPQSVIDKAERSAFSDVPGRSMEGLYVRGNGELSKICGIEICQ